MSEWLLQHLYWLTSWEWAFDAYIWLNRRRLLRKYGLGGAR